MPQTPGQRHRQARSVLNDERTLDAVVEHLDSGGWEGTSLGEIARGAGLSLPAVLDRYDNRGAAVVDAWHKRLTPALRTALESCVEVVDTEAPPSELLAALDVFVHPSRELRAAIEVLLVSRYDRQLADAVSDTISADLREWTVPKARRLTRADAARRTFVLGLALGCLVEARRGAPEQPLDLRPDVELMSAALQAHHSPTRLPSVRAEHLHGPPTFDTEDPALIALFTATLAEIGEYGYETATVRRIAKRAGYTTGLIFRRFGSKRDLFLDATARMLVGAASANHQFQMGIAEATSPGIADAVLTREFMHPDLKKLRTITYEQYRLSWHDPDMQASFQAAQSQILAEMMEMFPQLTEDQARARSFLALSRGTGIALLADLQPAAWELPLDVVTVPLVDGD